MSRKQQKNSQYSGVVWKSHIPPKGKSDGGGGEGGVN